MKRYYYLTMILIAIMMCCSSSFAQTEKIINLKDGSMIKGQIHDFQNGIYTVDTPHLGQVHIYDADILNISAPSENVPTQDFLPPMPSGKICPVGNADLMQQVQQLQGDLMTDEAVLQDIEEILKDPEVMSILSDPNFMNDVFSYDPARMQGNEKMQKLMEDPAMQALMDKIYQRMNAPQP